MDGSERNPDAAASGLTGAEALALFGGFRAGGVWPAGLNLLAVSRTDSTNSLARRLLARLEEEDEPVSDFLLLACEQTEGRGRGGRRWESPAGAGVYVTRVLRLPPGAAAIELPLRVPVALCAGLDELLGGRCRIKWPNDLLVSGRKLGGVLIEVLRSGEEEIALIGFGLNYRLAGAACNLPAATSFTAEVNQPLPLSAFAARMVTAVESELARLGPEPGLAARFRRWLVHAPGDEMRVRSGDELIHGRFVGLDDWGHLRLATAAGELAIATGEILE